ncbi:hypothetical protein D3C75_1251520 [compost metagenome]
MARLAGISCWLPAALNRIGTTLEAPRPTSMKPISETMALLKIMARLRPMAAHRLPSNNTLYLPSVFTTRSPFSRPRVMVMENSA